MKKLFLIFFIICTALSFTLSGCSVEGSASPSDEWSRVSNLSQLKGSWKGSALLPVPEIDLLDLLGEDGIPPELMLLLGGKTTLPPESLEYSVLLTVTNELMETNVIINCGQYLKNAFGQSSATMLWMILKLYYLNSLQDMGQFLDGMTIGFTDKDFEINAIAGIPLQDAEMDFSIDENYPSGIFINRNKSKLKMYIEITEDYPWEFILQKQK